MNEIQEPGLSLDQMLMVNTAVREIEESTNRYGMVVIEIKNGHPRFIYTIIGATLPPPLNRD